VRSCNCESFYFILLSMDTFIERQRSILMDQQDGAEHLIY
jgi:hypothetical protein